MRTVSRAFKAGSVIAADFAAGSLAQLVYR